MVIQVCFGSMNVKASVRDLNELYQALTILGEQSKSPKMVYAVARSINHLEPIFKTFHKTRDKKILELTNGTGQIPANDPRVEQLNQSVQADLDTEQEVEIHQFSLKESELAGLHAGALSKLLKHGMVTVEENV